MERIRPEEKSYPAFVRFAGRPFDAESRRIGVAERSSADRVSFLRNTYDDRDQLLTAVYSDYYGVDDETYVYDDNGNRELVTRTDKQDTPATGDDVATNHDFNTNSGAQNRIETDGTHHYEFDDQGNRIAKFVDNNDNNQLDAGDTDITEYDWDVENRLIEVVNRATHGGNETQVVDLIYDMYGHRIGMEVDIDGDGDVADNGDYRERYVWDFGRPDGKGNVVFDFVDDDFDGTAEASELERRYLWGTGVDQLFAQEDIGTSSRTTYWTLTDNLGTVRDLVTYNDATNATEHFERYIYEAFGAMAGVTDANGNPLTNAPKTRYQFTAQEFVSVIDAYYYDKRWYDAGTGQFISVDPVEYDTENLYRYVGNSPTNKIDPTGLEEVTSAAVRAHVFNNNKQSCLRCVENDFSFSDFDKTFGELRSSPFGQRSPEPLTNPRKIAEQSLGIKLPMTLSDRKAERLERSIKGSKIDYSMHARAPGKGLAVPFTVNGTQHFAMYAYVLPGWIKEGFYYRYLGVVAGSDNAAQMVDSIILKPIREGNEANAIAGAKATTEVAASVIPGGGEAQDLAVIGDPNESWWSKGFAVASLGLSAFTLGFAPNYGSGARAAGNIAEGAADAATAVNRASSKLVKQIDVAPKRVGRSGKQTRLRELANDPNVSRADRGWIKQEMNSIKRGQRTNIRVPPGKNLAHRRGFEAKKGFDYKHSDLQDIDLHKLQHKHGGY